MNYFDVDIYVGSKLFRNLELMSTLLDLIKDSAKVFLSENTDISKSNLKKNLRCVTPDKIRLSTTFDEMVSCNLTVYFILEPPSNISPVPFGPILTPKLEGIEGFMPQVIPCVPENYPEAVYLMCADLD